MTQPIDTALIRELVAKATPGPWRFDGDWHRLPTIYGANGRKVAIIEKTGIGRDEHTTAQAADARLIAAAPSLAAENARKDAEIERLRKVMREIEHSIGQARIVGNDWKRELALIENLAKSALGDSQVQQACTVCRTPDGILWLYSGHEWRSAGDSQ